MGSAWDIRRAGLFGASGIVSVNAKPGPGKHFRSPYSLGVSFGLALFASVLLWAALIALVVAFL
jgi:hypothetical protein